MKVARAIALALIFQAIALALILTGCNVDVWGALENTSQDYDNCFDREAYMTQSSIALSKNKMFFADEFQPEINQVLRLAHSCDNFDEYIMRMTHLRARLDQQYN